MKNLIIKCPHCGAEYLPEEIFCPESVFNKSLQITKDEDGKILYVDGEFSYDLNEEFCCEYCNHSFSIVGKTIFETKELKDDFDEEFVTEL